jgi:hypothetical protein
MLQANTLAYCDTVTIATDKRFEEQATGFNPAQQFL